MQHSRVCQREKKHPQVVLAVCCPPLTEPVTVDRVEPVLPWQCGAGARYWWPSLCGWVLGVQLLVSFDVILCFYRAGWWGWCKDATLLSFQVNQGKFFFFFKTLTLTVDLISLSIRSRNKVQFLWKEKLILLVLVTCATGHWGCCAWPNNQHTC